MKTILIPLDGSALAEQVLPYAQLLATTLSASILFLHVIPDFERADVLMHEAEVFGQLSGTRYGEHRHSPQPWTMLGQQAESYLAAPATSSSQTCLVTASRTHRRPNGQVDHICSRQPGRCAARL